MRFTANGSSVRTPTVQPTKMLRDARVAALAGRTAASWPLVEWQERAVVSPGPGE
jgi:hypothetical protein